MTKKKLDTEGERWIEEQKRRAKKEFVECEHKIVHIVEERMFVNNIIIYCKKCGRRFKR